MAKGSRALLILVGVALGVAGTLLLTASSGPPVQAQVPAAAQPLRPVDVARYQISTWGVGHSVGGKLQVANGAYIIDTHTGDVFSVTNENKPKPVGSVVEKK